MVRFHIWRFDERPNYLYNSWGCHFLQNCNFFKLMDLSTKIILIRNLFLLPIPMLLFLLLFITCSTVILFLFPSLSQTTSSYHIFLIFLFEKLKRRDLFFSHTHPPLLHVVTRQRPHHYHNHLHRVISLSLLRLHPTLPPSLIRQQRRCWSHHYRLSSIALWLTLSSKFMSSPSLSLDLSPQCHHYHYCYLNQQS